MKQLLFMHNSYFKVGTDVVGKQNKPAQFETSTDGFFLINMGFGADATCGKQTIEFGIFINNLFNTTYYNHLSTIKALGYYNMGRNISFLMKIPFQVGSASKSN